MQKIVFGFDSIEFAQSAWRTISQSLVRVFVYDVCFMLMLGLCLFERECSADLDSFVFYRLQRIPWLLRIADKGNTSKCNECVVYELNIRCIFWWDTQIYIYITCEYAIRVLLLLNAELLPPRLMRTTIKSVCWFVNHLEQPSQTPTTYTILVHDDCKFIDSRAELCLVWALNYLTITSSIEPEVFDLRRTQLPS